MTLDQFQRAQLVTFAHQEAAHTGSLHAMKAVCYIVRNRVRAGWHDGQWIEAIQKADESAGNQPYPAQRIDVYSRIFQILLNAIDDIYFSAASDDVERVVDKALYYQFVDRPLREEFTETILRHPESHPRRAVIGSMILFD